MPDPWDVEAILDEAIRAQAYRYTWGVSSPGTGRMQRFVDEAFNSLPDDAWTHEDDDGPDWASLAIRDLAADYYATLDPTEWQCRAIRRAGRSLTHSILPDIPRGYLIRTRD